MQFDKKLSVVDCYWLNFGSCIIFLVAEVLYDSLNVLPTSLSMRCDVYGVHRHVPMVLQRNLLHLGMLSFIHLQILC